MESAANQYDYAINIKALKKFMEKNLRKLKPNGESFLKNMKKSANTRSEIQGYLLGPTSHNNR